MLRKVLVSVVLIVPVLALAAGIAAWLVRTRPAASETNEPRRPPVVETIRVVRETVRDEVVGYGSARADRRAVLTAEVSAPVRRLADGLEEGVAVKQGELLIELDDREFQQQLTRATKLAAADAAAIEQLTVEEKNVQKLIAINEGEEKVARDEVARIANLFESGQAAKREYDLVRMVWYRADKDLQSLKNQLALLAPRRAQLDASRAARLAETELARLDVERCRIVAPFDGRVDELSTEMGEHVQPGRELLRIVALDRIEVPIELAASAGPRVHVGDTCRLALESLPDVHWEGKVARLSPSVDSRSRTFRAYIDVDNAEQDPPLQPGYFVIAVVEGLLIKDALLVPRVAVLEGGRVFVVNESRAHVRRVEVQRYVKDRAIVTGEIQADDRVIVTNLDKLSDGVDVQAGENAEP